MRMSEYELPFPSEALFRELPDLLAGPEPILEQPSVRAAVRNDEAARECVLVAAGIANALVAGRGGSQSLVARAPAAALAPIRNAAKYFANELMELAFEVGLEFAGRWARAVRAPIVIDQCTWRYTTPDWAARAQSLNDRISSLLEALQIPSDRSVQLKRALGYAAGDVHLPRRASLQLLEAADSLVPGLNNVLLWRLQLRHSSDQQYREVPIAALPPSITSRRALAFVHSRHAMDALSADEIQRAVEHIDVAESLMPGNVSVLFNSLLIACRVGDVARATREVGSFVNGLDEPGSVELFANTARMDRPLLRRNIHGTQEVLKSIASILPRSIAAAFEEALT